VHVCSTFESTICTAWLSKGDGEGGGEGSRAIELLIIKMVSTKHLSNKGKNKLNQKTSYM